MATIGEFRSVALDPTALEKTQETQNQTIASLQAQFQELAKQLADASTTSTEEAADAKTTKAK